MSLFDSIRSRSRLSLTPDNKAALGNYARRAHRIGWTWEQVGDAMQVSATSASYRAKHWRYSEQLITDKDKP